jgi:hypothetical protein
MSMSPTKEHGRQILPLPSKVHKAVLGALRHAMCQFLRLLCYEGGPRKHAGNAGKPTPPLYAAFQSRASAHRSLNCWQCPVLQGSLDAYSPRPQLEHPPHRPGLALQAHPHSAVGWPIAALDPALHALLPLSIALHSQIEFPASAASTADATLLSKTHELPQEAARSWWHTLPEVCQQQLKLVR